jgi:hypothetical protein
MDQFVRRQRRIADLVRQLGASTTLIPPKVLEAIRRHFGVHDCVLYLVSEVLLRGPRAFIGEFELQASGGVFWRPEQQELYAKTLPKCRLESAINSMLAHRKNAVFLNG